MKILTEKQEQAVDLLQSVKEANIGVADLIRRIKLHSGMNEAQASDPWTHIDGEIEIYKGLTKLLHNIAQNNFL